MQRLFKAKGWWLLLVWAVVMPVAQAKLPPPLVQAAAEAKLPLSAVGLWLARVGSERPLFSHQADKTFSAASTIKLVTTLAALQQWGPADQTFTHFRSASLPNAGVLTQPLVVEGALDASLSWQRLLDALGRLKALGLERIEAPVLIDRSGYSAMEPERAFDDQPWRAYHQRPDALTIEDGALRLLLMPGWDAQVHIKTEPPLKQLRINNRPKLVSGPCQGWGAVGYQLEAQGLERTLSFSGSYAASCGVRQLSLAPWSNAEHSRLALELALQQVGISHHGVMEDDGRAALAKEVLLSYASTSLSEVLRQTNKASNNVKARLLFQRLGAQTGVQQALAGLNLSSLVLENGSGLSRVEAISAHDLARVLQRALQLPAASDFVASLPIAGEDGTLQRAFADQSWKGQVRLKGGSLDGVRHIAGYANVGAERYVVVLLLQHPTAATAALPLQQALLQWLYKGR